MYAIHYYSPHKLVRSAHCSSLTVFVFLHCVKKFSDTRRKHHQTIEWHSVEHIRPPRSLMSQNNCHYIKQTLNPPMRSVALAVHAPT